MKHILIFAGTFTTGGVETVILNILRNIDRKYFTFDVLALRKTHECIDDELKEMGITVIKHASLEEVGVLNYYKSLCKVMKNNNYDIVHINGTLSSVVNLLAAKHCQIKKRIYHAHNTNDTGIEKINNQLIKNIIESIIRFIINKLSTEQLACGKEAAKFVYGNKVNKKIKIINNAVDTDKFHFLEESDYNNIKNSRNKNYIVVGNAARFTSVKNQIYAIKLIQLYKEKISKNICLLLAGDGDKKEDCLKYVKNNHLEENVVFLGNVNNMQDFYKQIDVFILPSLFEGLPVCAIEAQLSGVPMLLSDTISKESDIGIGLVEFYSLNKMEDWILGINKMINRRIFVNDSAELEKQVNKYSINRLIIDISSVYRCE